MKGGSGCIDVYASMRLAPTGGGTSVVQDRCEGTDVGVADAYGVVWAAQEPGSYVIQYACAEPSGCCIPSVRLRCTFDGTGTELLCDTDLTDCSMVLARC